MRNGKGRDFARQGSYRVAALQGVIDHGKGRTDYTQGACAVF